MVYLRNEPARLIVVYVVKLLICPVPKLARQNRCRPLPWRMPPSCVYRTLSSASKHLVHVLFFSSMSCILHRNNFLVTYLLCLISIISYDYRGNKHLRYIMEFYMFNGSCFGIKSHLFDPNFGFYPPKTCRIPS